MCEALPFLKELDLNALVLPDFYLKRHRMLCSVPCTSRGWESPLTPINTKEQKHHEIKSRFLMNLPLWDMASNICLFTSTTIFVFSCVSVASWRNTWLYCEQAEGGRRYCGVILQEPDHFLSSSHHGQRSWAIILFPEFLQLPNKCISSLNCW